MFWVPVANIIENGKGPRLDLCWSIRTLFSEDRSVYVDMVIAHNMWLTDKQSRMFNAACSKLFEQREEVKTTFVQDFNCLP